MSLYLLDGPIADMDELTGHGQGQRPVLCNGPFVLAAEGTDRLMRGRRPCHHHLKSVDEAFDLPAEDGLHQIVLVLKVIVKGALRHAAALGDLAHVEVHAMALDHEP